jgi:multicomponent Na+:H+ antiporter subunit G
MSLIGWIFMSAGAALLAVAALGVMRFPDALTRQHAATKAGTLGLGVMIIGLALLQPSVGWWVRLALLGVLLLITLPVASHALGRAADSWGNAREMGSGLTVDTEPEDR